jgi:rare lipoprotein A
MSAGLKLGYGYRRDAGDLGRMGGCQRTVDFGRLAQFGAVAVGCLALANCAGGKYAGKVDPKYGVSSSPRVVEFGEPVPKGGGSYRVGKPYMVAGRTYVPEENIHYRREGIASWYGDDFHGRLTANGEIFDMHSLSAAHPTLPLPSYVRVTNLANERSIVVRVNDRGPYAADRVIDLSVKTAQLLGFHDRGLARVRVEYVGRAPLKGSDDRELVATLRQGDPAPAPSAVRLASGKPFLPEYSDSDPERAERKAVAVAEERPHLLNQSRASSHGGEDLPLARPPVRSNARIEAAALPPVREAGAGAGPAFTSPVSAFAPTRYDAPAAFLSGRGLY